MGNPQNFTENLGNGIDLEIIYIPGGTFKMGTEDKEIKTLINSDHTNFLKSVNANWFSEETPQHEVTVSPFFMGKYPITQAQWRAIASLPLPKIKRDLDLNPAYFQNFQDSDRLPVENVSWDDAVEFCQRLSEKTGKEYRLPSEAEWEYACRAVISQHSSVNTHQLTVEEWNEKYNQPFHFGETITGELANCNAPKTYAKEAPGEYREKTTPVGSFPPNAFGLYDMHGNVWEWCQDDWHENYRGASTDGSAWVSGNNRNRNKVSRGGAWDSHPIFCRSAYRQNTARNTCKNNIGFRVVCDAPLYSLS